MKTIMIENLSRVFPMGSSQVNALVDVNLEVRTGDFIAIMGTSGSGKSTLLNILGLLDKPTKGKYWLEDLDVSLLSSNKLADLRGKRIGYIFQDFKLLPRLSAWENVALPLVYGDRHIHQNKQKKLALQALEKVNLTDRADHLPSELSGGQRQRTAIARALVTNPAVILADEPTGNLDSHTGQEILQLLLKLNFSGITIIMVTHDQTVAQHANNIFKMSDGHLLNPKEKTDVC
ncbi:MAG: ABC transporter ATP-binding protein [Anaerolineaceae bacterium]|nr:ABC transporter ATP-binding protein [Anaerolineaceae bacterium]